MLDNLQKYHVLLASKSPRRRELLNQLRIPYDIVSAGKVDEVYPDDIPALDVSQYLSALKANAFSDLIHRNELLITADTVVVLDGKVLGKPKNRDESIEMLRELSGKVHKVSSGVTITTKDRRTTFSCTTEVKLTDIDDEDIKYYVDNFSPFDKAGSYGIQEWIGCVAVEWIKGSYYNVIGLPLHRLYEELKLF